MSIERTVIDHYEREGLAASILERARAAAADPSRLTTADLAPFDDMHIGGRKATEHLFARIGFAPGMRVLDVGSGIGGPARFAAETYGAEVTGIDLTPGYKEVCEKLSQAVGLETLTEFVTGSALSMPFADGAFDAAYTIHVGMNIQDKATLYREVRRTLRPGARFGVYDIMAGQEHVSLSFPLPWADTQGSSFVVTLRAVCELLDEAGFDVIETESRREFALAALGRLMEHDSFKARKDDYPPKARNLFADVTNGLCAPWEVICVSR